MSFVVITILNYFKTTRKHTVYRPEVSRDEGFRCEAKTSSVSKLF